MTAIKAYIISFANDTERRAMLEERFSAIGLTPQFIDAVRGADLPDADKARFNGRARQSRLDHMMKDNAMGCALSHFDAWQTIVASGEPGGFIFEDDAIPLRDDTLMLMAELMRIADCLDIVSLANRRLKLKRALIHVIAPSAGLYALKGNDMGSEGYFITASAAQRMLRHPFRYGYELDRLIHHWWHHDCQVLHLLPPLFTEEGRPTSIGYDGLEPWPDDGPGIGLRRRLHRLRDSIAKRSRFASQAQAIRHRFARAGGR